MGLVKTQTIKNTLFTYLGFGLGAINVLFLFTNLLSDENYGLVQFIFSTSNILFPIITLGTHNAVIKFYSSYKTTNAKNQLLTLSLLFPLVVIMPLLIIAVLFYEPITLWLSEENKIIKNYAWLIVISGVSFSYFEIFFAWARVKLKSVFGNLMKEVFHRFCTSFLLIAFYFSWLTTHQLILSLVGVYVLRMAIMAVYASKIHSFKWTALKAKQIKPVLAYALVIVLAGTIASLILEIDKFMLSRYLSLENVAYYGVAIFIAAVIEVPSRSMYQITNPLTAKFLNNNAINELDILYKKSSILLFSISGLIFLLLALNKTIIYYFLPDTYTVAFGVVVIIGISKVFAALLSTTNAIVFNSKHYRIILVFGIALTILTIVLNYVLIPSYGIIGAAYASFIALQIYGIVKVVFVYKAYNITPFTAKTFYMLLVIFVIFMLFNFWKPFVHPIADGIIKSGIIILLYALAVLKLKILPEFNQLYNKLLKH